MWSLLRRQPGMGVLIVRHRPGLAAPGEARQGSPRGLIGEAGMTAVLALAGDVFTDAALIYGSTR